MNKIFVVDNMSEYAVYKNGILTLPKKLLKETGWKKGQILNIEATEYGFFISEPKSKNKPTPPNNKNKTKKRKQKR